jgi:hypothetical protein
VGAPHQVDNAAEKRVLLPGLGPAQHALIGRLALGIAPLKSIAVELRPGRQRCARARAAAQDRHIVDPQPAR